MKKCSIDCQICVVMIDAKNFEMNKSPKRGRWWPIFKKNLLTCLRQISYWGFLCLVYFHCLHHLPSIPLLGPLKSTQRRNKRTEKATFRGQVQKQTRFRKKSKKKRICQSLRTIKNRKKWSDLKLLVFWPTLFLANSFKLISHVLCSSVWIVFWVWFPATALSHIKWNMRRNASEEKPKRS